MMRTLLLLLPLLALQYCGAPAVSPAAGDPGYSQLITQAEQAEARGEILVAATAYRKAFALKPKEIDLAYKSANLFSEARDYRAAAEAYSLVPKTYAKPAFLGLEYGRALKQSGRPGEAQRVLTEFQAAFNGADRAIIGEIVANELEGLALEDGEPAGSATVTNLGRGVNSGGNETSPSLASPNRMLFASAQGGRNRILSSQLSGVDWERAAAPAGFPVISGGQFGSGSFATDGRSYFFTICSESSRERNARCEIYRTGRRLSGAWLPPTRLSAVVNSAAGSNATPTAVSLDDGRQILYFASSRPGGRGGMDIYRATQTDLSDPAGFGELYHLPPAINSLGDETTPAFDREKQMLYFSSNGHPGFGGYDIFSAERLNGTYESAINMGAPVNSPADDRGMTLQGATGVAFFYSNRAFSPEKETTTDDDIYQVTTGAAVPLLRATVYDEVSRRPLPDVEVSLLEVAPDRRETEITRRVFGETTYALPLEPGKSYRVVLRHPGYQAADYRVRTDASGASVYGRPIYLRSSRATPEQDRPVPTPGDGRAPGSSDPDLSPAAAPPTAYRIQIAAAKVFDPAETRYAAVRDIAELRTEAVAGRELKRVTVGYYDKIDVARTALEEIQLAGFPDAFIVRYDYGKRFGRVR